jgi:hypothetical protein
MTFCSSVNVINFPRVYITKQRNLLFHHVHMHRKHWRAVVPVAPGSYAHEYAYNINPLSCRASPLTSKIVWRYTSKKISRTHWRALRPSGLIKAHIPTWSHIRSSSSPWAHFWNSSSGWFSCLFVRCRTIDFHLVTIISPYPIFVDMALQYKWLRIPFIQHTNVSHPPSLYQLLQSFCKVLCKHAIDHWNVAFPSQMSVPTLQSPCDDLW